jgi:hypothetical protein
MIQTRDLMAIPFVDRGRSMHGADCWGFVMIVMKRFNKTIPDFDICCYDSKDIHGAKCFAESKFIFSKEPEAGSIVAMNLDRTAPTFTQHFGVCLDKTKFIQILEKRGVIITSINDRFFKNIIMGYYKWLE